MLIILQKLIGSLCEREHGDARAARDDPGLLSWLISREAMTEGSAILYTL